MQAFLRRACRAAVRVTALLLQLLAATWLGTPAGADHGGAAAPGPMNPVLVGVLVGALTLAAANVVVAIVMLLMRRPPPSG